jgi:hypothetical protein
MNTNFWRQFHQKQEAKAPEILVTVTMKSTIFWDVTPYSLVIYYIKQHHIQKSSSEVLFKHSYITNPNP